MLYICISHEREEVTKQKYRLRIVYLIVIPIYNFLKNVMLMLKLDDSLVETD